MVLCRVDYAPVKEAQIEAVAVVVSYKSLIDEGYSLTF